LTATNARSTVTCHGKRSELWLAYKKPVGDWVEAIRAEEALATSDHSIIAMEKWDAAHFNEQDAQKNTTEASEEYKIGNDLTGELLCLQSRCSPS
jgi:hypothetical protein